MEGRFISYIRVSTQKQGINGYGVEAQKKAISDYLNGGNWELLGLYQEVESGKKADRPELMKALEHCKRTKSTLLIGKLDRLSRNALFLFTLMENDVEFIAVDMPFANKLTIQLMAVMAENEREMISKRTREALQAARKRKGADFKIGNPKGLSKEAIEKGRPLGLQTRVKKADAYCQSRYPIIKEYLDSGLSLRAIAKKMEEKKERTPRDGEKWTATTVKQILKRVESRE